MRFGRDTLRDDDFITDGEKPDADEEFDGDVTTAVCCGNVLGGVSADNLLRDRLRYSNKDTCRIQRMGFTLFVFFVLRHW